MKHIVVVTNLLPHYQIEFFNRLVELDSDIKLTVLAETTIKSNLNHVDTKKCNFNIVNTPSKKIAGMIFKKSIRKKIERLKPDYLVFYGNPREISLSLLMLYYKLTGKKFLIHGMFHRIGGETKLSLAYYHFVNLVAHRLLTYSNKGANVLISTGISFNKIRIIGTAINEKKPFYFSSKINENDLTIFKKQEGLLGKKVVLQVVRLTKPKSPHLLIEVAKKLKDTRPDIIFVLIGDGDLYNYIKNEIASNNLEHTVLQLGAIYDEEILSYWYNAADLFVIPTCIGLSAHHAFAYSLPIITDDDLSTQASEFDILSPGLNSLTYEHGNIEDLQAKILKILDDDALRGHLSSNAFDTVNNTHTIDSKCLKYLSAIKE